MEPIKIKEELKSTLDPNKYFPNTRLPIGDVYHYKDCIFTRYFTDGEKSFRENSGILTISGGYNKDNPSSRFYCTLYIPETYLEPVNKQKVIIEI